MEQTLSTKIVNGQKYKTRIVTAGLRAEVTTHTAYRYHGGKRLYVPQRNSAILRKRKDNIARAQKKIRLLTFANSKKIPPLLIRLSYVENQTNRKVAQEDVARFTRRLRAKYPAIKFMYVFEYQERGALHAHMLIFGLAFIPFGQIESMWGKGGTRVERSKGREQTGNYVGKYVGKALDGAKSLRGYSSSHSLEKPVVEYTECFLNRAGAWHLQKSHTRSIFNELVTISIYRYDFYRR